MVPSSPSSSCQNRRHSHSVSVCTQLAFNLQFEIVSKHSSNIRQNIDTAFKVVKIITYPPQLLSN